MKKYCKFSKKIKMVNYGIIGISVLSKESINTSLMTIDKTNQKLLALLFKYLQGMVSGKLGYCSTLSFFKSKNTSLMIFGQTIFHISWPLGGNVPKIILSHTINIFLNIIFLELSLVCFIHDTFLLPTFCTEPVSLFQLSAFWLKGRKRNKGHTMHAYCIWSSSVILNTKRFRSRNRFFSVLQKMSSQVYKDFLGCKMLNLSLIIYTVGRLLLLSQNHLLHANWPLWCGQGLICLSRLCLPSQLTDFFSSWV